MKRSMISINNDRDSVCFARAVVVVKCLADKEETPE